ncbi:hypothetical protein N0V85_006242 [Neurospora sp. IMI 360204]|nr:hypothetical protein N0V85_006242 [Neurospora sp. IMI 360204]
MRIKEREELTPAGDSTAGLMTPTTATTFHLFPCLPWEIRSRIWELTVEPRTVEVRISYVWQKISAKAEAKYRYGRLGILALRSSTPVPAPLQTCREARNHLTSTTKKGHRYYQQAFSKLPAARWFFEEIKCENPEDRLELGLEAEPRYIWVDFDVDMISIGRSPFQFFESYYSDIKRLKFARDNTCQYFNEYESQTIREFVHAEEIHVVCLGPYGTRVWEGAHEDHCFPCDKDKLWLMDPKEDGRMVKAADNDVISRETRWAGHRANGAFINPDTMQPFVPFLPPGWFEGQEEWDNIYLI